MRSRSARRSTTSRPAASAPARSPLGVAAAPRCSGCGPRKYSTSSKTLRGPDVLGEVRAAGAQDAGDLRPVGRHRVPAGDEVEGAVGEGQRRRPRARRRRRRRAGGAGAVALATFGGQPSVATVSGGQAPAAEARTSPPPVWMSSAAVGAGQPVAHGRGVPPGGALPRWPGPRTRRSPSPRWGRRRPRRRGPRRGGGGGWGWCRWRGGGRWVDPGRGPSCRPGPGRSWCPCCSWGNPGIGGARGGTSVSAGAASVGCGGTRGRGSVRGAGPAAAGRLGARVAPREGDLHAAVLAAALL